MKIVRRRAIEAFLRVAPFNAPISRPFFYCFVYDTFDGRKSFRSPSAELDGVVLLSTFHGYMY